MPISKRLATVILLISVIALVFACRGGGDITPVDSAPNESTSDASPQSTATAEPPGEPLTISLPDEARALYEVWRIVQREYVDIDTVDARVLSDGAIFGILEATEDTSLSIADARALEYDLELEENYFSVPGGEELEEAYEVLAYAYTQPSDTALGLEDLNTAAIKGMVGALADPYTSYLSRDDLWLEQSDLEGSFHGIGAYVGHQ